MKAFEVVLDLVTAAWVGALTLRFARPFLMKVWPPKRRTFAPKPIGPQPLEKGTLPLSMSPAFGWNPKRSHRAAVRMQRTSHRFITAEEIYGSDPKPRTGS